MEFANDNQLSKIAARMDSPHLPEAEVAFGMVTKRLNARGLRWRDLFDLMAGGARPAPSAAPQPSSGLMSRRIDLIAFGPFDHDYVLNQVAIRLHECEEHKFEVRRNWITDGCEPGVNCLHHSNFERLRPDPGSPFECLRIPVHKTHAVRRALQRSLDHRIDHVILFAHRYIDDRRPFKKMLKEFIRRKIPITTFQVGNDIDPGALKQLSHATKGGSGAIGQRQSVVRDLDIVLPGLVNFIVKTS